MDFPAVILQLNVALALVLIYATVHGFVTMEVDADPEVKMEEEEKQQQTQPLSSGLENIDDGISHAATCGGGATHDEVEEEEEQRATITAVEVSPPSQPKPLNPPSHVIEIFTDLEPDDIMFNPMLLRQEIAEGAHIRYIVGEGQCPLQVKRGLLDVLCREWINDGTFVEFTYEILHGMQSSREFIPPAFALPIEGKPYTCPLIDCEWPEVRVETVFMIKPPREIFALLEQGKEKELKARYKNTTCMMYGSANFRMLLDEGLDLDQLTEKTKQLIGIFREFHWVETHGLIGERNAMGLDKDPEICQAIMNSPVRWVQLYKEAMKAWNSLMYEKMKKKVENPKLNEKGEIADPDGLKRAKKIVDGIEKADGVQMVMADVLVAHSVDMNLLEPAEFLRFGSKENPNDKYPKFKYEYAHGSSKNVVFTAPPRSDEEKEKRRAELIKEMHSCL
jgi:hypothetical protein